MCMIWSSLWLTKMAVGVYRNLKVLVFYNCDYLSSVEQLTSIVYWQAIMVFGYF